MKKVGKDMRVILIVLDALGIGKKQNIGTLNHLLENNSDQEFSFFRENDIVNKKLEHKKYLNKNVYKTYSEPLNPIPDSYLGHSEIIGQSLAVDQVYIEDIYMNLVPLLAKDFNNVHYSDGLIVVDDMFVIGNNGECQPGLNLNILWLKSPTLSDSEMDTLAKNLLHNQNYYYKDYWNRSLSDYYLLTNLNFENSLVEY